MLNQCVSFLLHINKTNTFSNIWKFLESLKYSTKKLIFYFCSFVWKVHYHYAHIKNSVNFLSQADPSEVPDYFFLAACFVCQEQFCTEHGENQAWDVSKFPSDNQPNLLCHKLSLPYRHSNARETQNTLPLPIYHLKNTN